MKNTETEARTCSFCGNNPEDPSHAVAGEEASICGNCIKLCYEIVSNAEDKGKSKTPLEEMYPKMIKEFLDEHVIGQDRAKRALSVAVYNHYKRVRSELFHGTPPDQNEEEKIKTDSEAQEKGHFKTELTGKSSLEANSKENQEDEENVELTKGNILLIGPTGCGKTLMARTLAKKLDVPFTIADATTLTEAGYVGEDVENIIKNLWMAANRSVERASEGIVCIDEIDKLGSRPGSASARDVGGEGVQQALLKMVESSQVTISPEGSKNHPQQSLITIDTTNVLFICCGSFQGLTDLIARRLGKSRVGFGDGEKSEKKSDQTNILREVQPKDLNQFGLIPEFIGRFPVIVTFDQLEEKQLVEILWKPKNSLISQYQKLFRIEGVKLQFKHDALVAMVQKAIQRGVGARGLRSIIEEVMLDVMYEIPSLHGVTECIITKECVTHGEQPSLVYSRKIA